MSYSAAPTVQDIAHLPCAHLPDVIHVPPLTRPFNVTITPPGSKSLTNRALLLAALADGESTLTNALIDADDTRVMIAALRQLGAEIRVADPGEAPGADGAPGAKPGGSGRPAAPTLHIRGTSGRWQVPPAGVTLNLENAGTAVRFLTAAAILAAPGSGPITIDGDDRMRNRPIAELLTALHSLGATFDFVGTDGCLPVRILAPADLASARRFIHIGEVRSSQFISALLLTAPFLPGGLGVNWGDGPNPSFSYIEMTVAILHRLGFKPWDLSLDGEVHVPPCQRQSGRPGAAPFCLDIEPDASSATYFWAAAALNRGSTIHTPGIGSESLQGDASFVASASHVDRQPRATTVTGSNLLRPIDGSFWRYPDSAMTAAVLACFAAPTSHNRAATSILRGLSTLRFKESDRLTALQTELTKLGATVEIRPDDADVTLHITPPPGLATPSLFSTECHPSPSSLRGSVASSLPPITFDTYNDHRMAMSLALIGLRRPNVFIKNPACVAKTYPTFWRDLSRLY